MNVTKHNSATAVGVLRRRSGTDAVTKGSTHTWLEKIGTSAEPFHASTPAGRCATPSHASTTWPDHRSAETDQRNQRSNRQASTGLPADRLTAHWIQQQTHRLEAFGVGVLGGGGGNSHNPGGLFFKCLAFPGVTLHMYGVYLYVYLYILMTWHTHTHTHRHTHTLTYPTAHSRWWMGFHH